jgi:hypothetical protein
MIIIKHLKKLDYQRDALIIKSFDNQVQEHNNQINEYPKRNLICRLVS